VNRAVWDTPELIACGITFHQDEHWWSLGVLRKERACGHCERPLKPGSLAYVRRIGPSGRLCQPCGQSLRDRDKPREVASE